MSIVVIITDDALAMTAVDENAFERDLRNALLSTLTAETPTG
ncbi:hypothetical protein [Mesorhizobium sp. M0659]